MELPCLMLMFCDIFSGSTEHQVLPASARPVPGYEEQLLFIGAWTLINVCVTGNKPCITPCPPTPLYSGAGR